MPISYELGVEEIALAMSLAGDPQNANGLLDATFGPLSAEDRAGRLMAAGSSLAARSLLSAEAGTDPTLDAQLLRVIRVLLRPAFTIKYDKARPGTMDGLSYHFAQGEDLVLEHTVRQGVVHKLSDVKTSEVVLRGARFLSIPKKGGALSHEIRLRRFVYDEARSRCEMEPTVARVLLQGEGMPAKEAEWLVDDLRHGDYEAGVFRIDYDAETIPYSDRAFLVVQGKRRTWILSPVVGDGDVHIVPSLASVKRFEQELQALMG